MEGISDKYSLRYSLKQEFTWWYDRPQKVEHESMRAKYHSEIAIAKSKETAELFKTIAAVSVAVVAVVGAVVKLSGGSSK